MNQVIPFILTISVNLNMAKHIKLIYKLKASICINLFIRFDKLAFEKLNNLHFVI